MGSDLVVAILASKVSALGWATEAPFASVFLLGAGGTAMVAATVFSDMPETQHPLTPRQQWEVVAPADAGAFETAGVAG
ncbi:hypothetical protein [Nakamurella sp. PAMC28650]|uniref:hypothetical protein n=1 Tax=Nakamurella sp. PAMC28650 TaxID=2762325 RepID=UPI00164D0CD3|nr:hypothetical protein [Nakamurella sp. PAMC28650]QNK82444.1 hypothetical protein H7F38_06885 [Nakamurella sp. PAMC28650]